ncbi:alpha/beta hydrolase [Aureococcus anophagefferens]|nr:alpha/beta hydrolase [Aureococcus anophagefferens]
MGWSHDARAFSPARLPLRDGDAPRPRESYGLSKEVGDAVGAAYARACGLEVASLRFTNVVKRDAFRSLPWASARRSSCARAAARATPRSGGRTVGVAYGYSMGAMQALALARGGGVAAVVAVCGAAGCSDYNRVFLDALDAALEGGDRSAALRAFALVYAGWGVSYDFYAERAWARLGFEDLDDFLERSYVAGFATDDPDDLRAMLACWRAAAERPPGLEAIEARCLFLPCDTDAPPGAYFRAGEIERRVATIPGATLRPIRSPFGHRAGDPWRDGMDAERAFIRAEVGAFLGNS